MKPFFLTTIFAFLIANFSIAQSGHDTNKSIFKGLKVRFGLTGSYSYQINEDWKYILHSDSKFHLERQRPDNGIPLSVVFLFPVSKDEVFNILLNIPFADVANGKNLFNSRIPFGIGTAIFPWPKSEAKFFGLTFFGSFGSTYKMTESAYNDPSVVFPIANYLGYNLSVGKALPEEVIKPFCDQKTTYSLNVGFVFRLVY